MPPDLMTALLGFALASSITPAFGALMRTLLNTPLRMRAFNVVMALLLVASAMPVAYDLLILSRGSA